MVIVDAGSIVSEALIEHQRASVVDDGELVSLTAPVHSCEHGHCIASFEVVPQPHGVLDLVARHGARSATPNGQCRARHRREGQVCRRTSKVTLPRPSPAGGE